MQKLIILLSALILLGSCSELPPKPYAPSPAHINAAKSVPQDNIPGLVRQAPVLPEPAPPLELEKYTVVVNEVPVKEILFALARDAKINVDIGPGIEGDVTLNAVDQTLPQILDRIARQVSIRYEFKDGNLIIEADKPFFRSYTVNYLNMARDTKTEVKIATQLESTGGGAVGGGGGGQNNSITEVSSVAANHFWDNLVKDVLAILGQTPKSSSSATGITVTDTVIPHPETGVLTVKATSKQHELIQTFIDNALASAHRQVLIQATIVEVALNDQYSAGVDWSVLGSAGTAGVNAISSTFLGFPDNLNPGLPTAGPPAFLLNYTNGENANRVINATINLLEQFGDIKVLSSPQIVAMNNQSALLKVVDNVVYFTIKQETNIAQTGIATNTFETTVHSVPVGIVMSLTPQINENDSIILNVRPTISRISGFVNDPNPGLTVVSQIPEIQVSEMESVLRINHGQVAVLGGLMQDNTEKTDQSIPGLSKIPLLGEAFKTRNRNNLKNELVIFLRPTVIRNPSLDGDLDVYKSYLKKSGGS